MDVRRRAKQVFLDVLDAPAARQLEVLAARCAGDAELRQHVEDLLRAHHEADSALGPVPDPRDDAPGPARPGQVLGPYRLQRVIGEGGFGVVWLAEQSEPLVRRVAIKLLKAPLTASGIAERFAREREALARMDHPGIAKVLDAGTTPGGQPFVVMELVDGAPITAYCDAACLPHAARLRLFVEVCAAVQHAHHKGVVHRDIKPGNLLVAAADDGPRVKVIDFGIAKAIGDDTLGLTAAGQVLGTPEFMAPEQATPGADIDTRADVYSLGVVLYHLLTGASPYDRTRLDRGGLLAWSQAICEADPLPPSRRVLGLSAEQRVAAARARALSPERLAVVLRGELDWIVQRALHKDRTQRYATAAALAGDLERYLHGEPIEAGPPSQMYRLRKLCARHRVAASALAVAFVTAVLAAVFSAHQAVVATRATRLAELSGYTANVYAAAAAVRDGDPREARRRLAAVPTHLRHLEWHLLAGEVDRGEWSVAPATVRVEALATHARAVAVACSDGSVHVYALTPGAAPSAARSLHGLARPVRELVLVGADAVLWTGDRAGRLVRWDWLRDHRSEAQLPGAIESLDASADGSLVAVACDDGTVRGYRGDVQSEQLSLRHAAPAHLVRVATGGETLAVATFDQQLTVWDRAGSQRARLRPARPNTANESPARFARGNVSAVAFVSDGNRLAVATRDGRVSVFAPDAALVWDSDEHQRVVRSLVWSPSGDRLFAIGRSVDATLWQADGTLVASMPLRSDGRGAVFSTDGTRLATVGFDGCVRLWDGLTGEPRGELLGHDGYVYGVASTPDGDLWSFGEDCTLRRWPADLPSKVAVPLSAWAHAVAFAADGELVVGDTRGRASVWDLPAARLRHDVTLPDAGVTAVLPLDGGRVACGLADGQIAWLAGRPFAMERRIDAHQGRVAGLALVAGGREIASSGHDGRVRLFLADSGAACGELAFLATAADPQARELRELAASRDGSRLCAVSKFGRVGVFAVVARRALAHYDVAIGAVEALAVDQDLRRIAVGGDRDIAVIDAATGAVVVLRGHTDAVTALAWSPDGSRLVSASRDATVRLWDPVRGEGLLALAGGSGALHAVAISGDGRLIAAVGEMAMVRLWHAPAPGK